MCSLIATPLSACKCTCHMHACRMHAYMHTCHTHYTHQIHTRIHHIHRWATTLHPILYSSIAAGRARARRFVHAHAPCSQAHVPCAIAHMRSSTVDGRARARAQGNGGGCFPSYLSLHTLPLTPHPSLTPFLPSSLDTLLTHTPFTSTGQGERLRLLPAAS